MNALSFSLRPAIAQDAHAIRSLVYLGGINPTGLDWRRFCVAVSERGEVIGCGQIKPHRDGTRELASIVVHPHWRKRGVASAVIESLIRDAEKSGDLPGSAYRGLYLICRESLGSFYARFGFRAVPEAEIPPHFRRMTRLFRALKKVSGMKAGPLVMHRREGSTRA